MQKRLLSLVTVMHARMAGGRFSALGHDSGGGGQVYRREAFDHDLPLTIVGCVSLVRPASMRAARR